MLARLFDQNHELIGIIKDLKNAKVETTLSTGDKVLSFLWHQSNVYEINAEYYIQTEEDEFVVKENNAGSNGYREIVAQLNLEDLEGKTWEKFISENSSAKELVDYAIANTGWTCVSEIDSAKKRSISMSKVSSYNIIERVLEAFICEVEYDTLHKKIKIVETKGSDKGCYFIRGLNLKELKDTQDSYDYVTRLIPYGANGIDITTVEPAGNNYLENFQYSNKKKEKIWEDTSYTDAQELYQAAIYYLNELSKPKKTYSAKIIDLAKLSQTYSTFEYETGDVITLVDAEKRIREKQRITKTIEYYEHPENNTCEISNTVLSFEDLQKKLQAAAECIGNITTDNGTVDGSKVDKIDATQVIGLDRYIAEDMDELTVKNLYVSEKFGATSAALGNLVSTDSTLTNLKVVNKADINIEYVDESNIDNLYAQYGKFEVLESKNIAAMEEKISNLQADSISTDYLEANYANIKLSNIKFADIEKATIDELLVNSSLIKDAVISMGKITGELDAVKINAGNISAGTLDAATIDVINLNCASLTVGSINGKQIAQGAISSGNLDKGLNQTLTDTQEGVENALKDAGLAVETANDVKDNSVYNITLLYANSPSAEVAPENGWSEQAPDWQEGMYLWQKKVTAYGDGTKVEADPVCMSGTTGASGEDATVLKIDSSRGTVFKNNAISTVLSVVVFHGGTRITDIQALKAEYGSSAYLEWHWQRMVDNEFGVMSATDSRISDNGFSFTLTPEDIDTKCVFMCNLITN